MQGKNIHVVKQIWRTWLSNTWHYSFWNTNNRMNTYNLCKKKPAHLPAAVSSPSNSLPHGTTCRSNHQGRFAYPHTHIHTFTQALAHTQEWGGEKPMKKKKRRERKGRKVRSVYAASTPWCRRLAIMYKRTSQALKLANGQRSDARTHAHTERQSEEETTGKGQHSQVRFKLGL